MRNVVHLRMKTIVQQPTGSRKLSRYGNRISCALKLCTTTIHYSEVFPQFAALKSRTTTYNFFL
jgi:hypothetical protein